MCDKRDNKSTRINELINELNECRADFRHYEYQIFFAAASFGAILSAIYGLSVVKGGNQFVYFLVSVFIFSSAFPYVVTLGITGVLRHHYIRDIEDRLTMLIPVGENEKEFIHWTSFSSPITTRNFKHLKSAYSKGHYIFYSIFIAAFTLVCASTVFMQYREIYEEYKLISNILISISVFIMLISIVSFIIYSIKSKKMYEFSLMQSIEDRKKRIKKNNYSR